MESLVFAEQTAPCTRRRAHLDTRLHGRLVGLDELDVAEAAEARQRRRGRRGGTRGQGRGRRHGPRLHSRLTTAAALALSLTQAYIRLDCCLLMRRLRLLKHPSEEIDILPAHPSVVDGASPLTPTPPPTPPFPSCSATTRSSPILAISSSIWCSYLLGTDTLK